MYWEDGAQITAPKDKQIIAEVNAVEDYASVKTMKKEEAIEKGLYQVIDKELDDRYMEELHKQVMNQECLDEVAKEISCDI